MRLTYGAIVVFWLVMGVAMMTLGGCAMSPPQHPAPSDSSVSQPQQGGPSPWVIALLVLLL
jgi:hypothetical protein